MFRIWDVFHYIFKWRFLIIIITIASAFLGYSYVKNNQQYTAETIIKYVGGAAEQGLTENGEVLDPYKIISPTVISNALELIGNTWESVDKVIKNIEITPIIPKEIEEIRKAKIDDNEEFEYFPVYYSITYKVPANKNGAYARDILDAVMSSYAKYYSENHLNLTSVSELEFNLESGQHDYLEIAELLNKKISDMISYLKSKKQTHSSFRSPTTGLSFADLESDYEILRNTKMPLIYSEILDNAISKDTGVLIKKYGYRKDLLNLDSESKTRLAEETWQLMEEYATSTVKQLDHNVFADNENREITQVVTNWYYGREKITYDQLVDQYVAHATNASLSTINASYCNDIINIYSNSNPYSNSEMQISNVSKEIISVKDKLESLYKQTSDTIEDYNRYLAMTNILTVAGISLKVELSSTLYSFLAFVVGFGFSVVLAVAIEIIRKLAADPEKVKERVC